MQMSEWRYRIACRLKCVDGLLYPVLFAFTSLLPAFEAAVVCYLLSNNRVSRRYLVSTFTLIPFIHMIFQVRVDNCIVIKPSFPPFTGVLFHLSSSS